MGPERVVIEGVGVHNVIQLPEPEEEEVVRAFALSAPDPWLGEPIRDESWCPLPAMAARDSRAEARFPGGQYVLTHNEPALSCLAPLVMSLREGRSAWLSPPNGFRSQ